MTTAVTGPRPAAQLSTWRVVGRRLVAAGLDLLLLPSILSRLGDVLVGGVGEVAGWVLGIAAAVAAQGLVGASLGMMIVGLAVHRADGPQDPPGLRRAALRHAWVLAPPLAAVPSLVFSLDAPDAVLVAASIAGSLLGLVGIALPPLLLGTVIADAAGRGLHDRWSGTAVRPIPAPGRARATIVILLLLWMVMTAAAWWLGSPDRVESDRLGGPDVTSATCDVTYDPPVGPSQERTVELAPGMARTTVRLGPHVASFDDEPFPRTRPPSSFGDPDIEPAPDTGLFYELRAQSSGGMSSSSGSGSSDGSFHQDIEVDGGLAGELAMRCRGEDPASAPITPSVRPSD